MIATAMAISTMVKAAVRRGAGIETRRIIGFPGAQLVHGLSGRPSEFGCSYQRNCFWGFPGRPQKPEARWLDRAGTSHCREPTPGKRPPDAFGRSHPR